MNTAAIIYASIHHKNTLKLLENAKQKFPIDIYDIKNIEDVDLSKYKTIGFASGIYMSDFHKAFYSYLNKNPFLPKNIFLIYTSGSGGKKYANKIKNKLKSQNIDVIDIFSCKGYDTYGLFKFIGGISKSHPNQNDIDNFLKFIQNILSQLK